MSGGQWMIVLIVLIAVIGGVMKSRNRSEPRGDGETGNADAARLRDEVRTLKERIAVLERIATDKDSHLDREIERLRDK